MSDDKEKRKKSFELLDIAVNNQDLPDDIFIVLELARAGYSIAN